MVRRGAGREALRCRSSPLLSVVNYGVSRHAAAILKIKAR